MECMRELIEKNAAVHDVKWYSRVLKNQPASCELSKEEEREILFYSMETAEKYASQLKKDYGAVSGASLAGTLGLTIKRTKEELRKPFLYMGIYEPEEGTVILNDSTLNAIKGFIKEYGLTEIIREEALEEIVLFHEIFHWIEENTPGIYTRSKMLKRPVWNLFPKSRGLDGAGEVGAIHFSKIMSGVSYSPCLYEMCLLIKTGVCSIDFFSSIL
ncbi:MAG: hypothetical protein E7243_13440 [Lacrimispora celerecrescens]|nr:hypothetical protein [Lacrimispora celerecrescens]